MCAAARRLAGGGKAWSVRCSSDRKVKILIRLPFSWCHSRYSRTLGATLLGISRCSRKRYTFARISALGPCRIKPSWVMCGSPAKGHRVGPLGISTLHWKRALGICRSGQAGMSFNRGRTGGRRQLAATKHEGKCGSTTDLTSTRRTRTRATSQPLLRKRNLYTHLEQTSKRVQTLKHVAYYHVRANKLQQSGKHSAKPSSLALNSFSTHTPEGR